MFNNQPYAVFGGAVALGNALKVNTALREVWLSDNKITSKGVCVCGSFPRVGWRPGEPKRVRTGGIWTVLLFALLSVSGG